MTGCVRAQAAGSRVTLWPMAAVAVAMETGCTWAEIATALGVSSQAAHRRFRWLRHSALTDETWHEPPLPIRERSR